MGRDEIYEDEITLLAVSNIYSVEIDIVSTLGQLHFVRILPQNSKSIFRKILEHFTKVQSFHYFVLNRNNRAEEPMVELGSADKEVRSYTSNNQNHLHDNSKTNNEGDPSEKDKNSQEIKLRENYGNSLRSLRMRTMGTIMTSTSMITMEIIRRYTQMKWMKKITITWKHFNWKC